MLPPFHSCAAVHTLGQRHSEQELPGDHAHRLCGVGLPVHDGGGIHSPLAITSRCARSNTYTDRCGTSLSICSNECTDQWLLKSLQTAADLVQEVVLLLGQLGLHVVNALELPRKLTKGHCTCATLLGKEQGTAFTS